MNHPAAEIVTLALRKILKAAPARKYPKLTDACKHLQENIHTLIPPLPEGKEHNVPKQSLHEFNGNEGPDNSQHVVDDAASEAGSEFGTQEQTSAHIIAATGQDQAEGVTSIVETHSAETNVVKASEDGVAASEMDLSAVDQAGGIPTITVQDLVPRTESALSDEVCLALVSVMRLAVETGRPQILEAALDCLQKLIAFRFLQGGVHVINQDKTNKEEATARASDPTSRSPQAQAVELMCMCDEIPDEVVELQVLKGLLTATTSTTFTIHGQALLAAVRTCYNIYLMSRSEVNQTTAKATLTQTVNVVFQRMEADCVLVEVRPIVVSDVMGPPRQGTIDAGGVNTVVQTFLNNVIMISALAYGEVEDIRSNVAGAFEGQVVMPGGSDSEDEKEHFKLKTTPVKSGSSGKVSAADGSLSGASPVDSAGQTGTLQPTASSGSSAVLLRDAFLVFRALCKLSIRTSDNQLVSDPNAVRGQVLAQELLKILLENSGPTFRTNKKFISAIRQHLCLSLLKNSASSIPQALQLSCSIFMSLLSFFRASLKAEVGVFFPMILLKPLEPPVTPGQQAGVAAASPLSAASIQHRAVVMKYITTMCKDGQLLVDLFANYDCDLESSNLFERLVNGLVKLAQTPVPPPSSGGLSSLGVLADPNLYHQEQFMRQEALEALVSVVESMHKWYLAASGVRDENEEAKEAGDDSGTGSNRHKALESIGPTSGLPTEDSPGVTGTSGGAEGDGMGDGTTPEGMAGSACDADLVSRRAYKQRFQEGLALFNKKPKKGIEYLQTKQMLGRSPEDVAAFLTRTSGLNKTLVGDYLGEREDFNLKVMHAYVDAMDFTNLEFDQAIRVFLSGFRLPGEAQKIDRLMEKFAERYVKNNPASFKSADVGYVLAYSVIMLNTDAHNPQVKSKMSKEGFLKNNRGINDGQDLAPEFLGALYDRIVNNEIKMRDEIVGESSTAAANAAAHQQSYGFVNTVLSLMGAFKQQVSTEPSAEAIKHTLEYLHQKATSASLATTTEPDAVRPMMEVIWAPLLGALSVLFDEYSDPRLVRLCLSGFLAGACITCRLAMAGLCDVFINSLCSFTHLHSPSGMRFKHALAFKTLLSVADKVGDHLSERWVEVLRCVSRWELLQQLVSDTPTDAALFSPARATGMRAAAEALQVRLRQLLNDEMDSGLTATRSIDNLTMNEINIKRINIREGGSFGSKRDMDQRNTVPLDVIQSIDNNERDRIFSRSANLDSEAIVHFVRAMTHISLDELSSPKAPRVFSLTKIVEIAHFNMNRIRLVWSRIWSVLSEYFIEVGCHPNLAVAQYAVDSLRQLSMKFLGRDELANYTFQTDFLRPFVVVMRRSQSVEIRDYIIRCVSQMVLAHVTNMKSGWKSVFMVFTAAAGDKNPSLVRLAFDTIEKIVREHFVHITETETTTFTDCVNCLIAFTNNPHFDSPASHHVALNSIAFLRFCAAKLAEGKIGDLNNLPEGMNEQSVPTFRLKGLDADYSQSSSFQPQRLPVSSSSTLLEGAHQPSPAEQALSTSIAKESTAREEEGSPPTASRQGSLNVTGSLQVGTTHAQQVAGTLKFVDKEEHVYFWFPLLAGLSELTFDPRRDIRNGALGVLFDTLHYHGASFAGSFWKRIFDSVLLPIFDHVRAEVTDTTTFTSEKKRMQEDAWLYETCTRCLQHLIDVFVKFYGEAHGLMGRLLLLLRSFITRSHVQLACAGVAALVRLTHAAGPLMNEEEWSMVISCYEQTVDETLPNAMELVTPPQRLTSYDSLNLQNLVTSATSTSSSPTSAPTPTRTFTLRDGVGARWLAKFRCQCGVQLLLVQACGEVYLQHHEQLPASAMLLLLQALEKMANHGLSTNQDMLLRRRLAMQQAEDRIPEERGVPDPPLLRLEAEAGHAYLTVLMHLLQVVASLRPELGQPCAPQTRITRLCLSVLNRYATGASAAAASQSRPDGLSSTVLSSSGIPARPNTSTSSNTAAVSAVASPTGSVVVARTSAGAPVLMASPSAEFSSFAPLVVAALRALMSFDDPMFREQLPQVFPLVTTLIRCDYAPPDVHKALSELFMTRIGPLVTPPAS